MTNCTATFCTETLVSNIMMISGNGQHHTARADAENPKPYGSVSLDDIMSMVKNPSTIEKSEAQWVIPSSTGGPDARVFKYQLDNGLYHFLWADLDKVPLTVLSLPEIMAAILPDTHLIIYNTKSATPENQKCRIIVPLAEPCTGQDYCLYQKILNDKIEAMGIEPDRATERPAQLCYLPNRGDFYNFHIVDGNSFSISSWEEEHQAEIIRAKELEQAIEVQRQQARLKAQERKDTGQCNPVAAFNEHLPIESALILYGFKQCGKKWISPLSKSGNPGVIIKDSHIFSHHNSDSGIGKSAAGGGIVADAFDLFVHFDHGGNYDAAVRAAGEQFFFQDPIKGDTVTLNKYNQREHKRQQEHNAATRETEKKPTEAFDIRAFSLNGRSREMEKQMLEDKFALLRMAILGQSTVFYAKPNAGKTLIILYGIREGIKNGEIKGDDVIYVNADDTYKGLVYKLKIAEQYGFHMVAPGHSVPGGAVFKSQDLAIYINNMISNGTASGKIFILDTVKKFTDLMSKDKCSKFGETIRQFISHGGTVISVAHANKHRDDDKKIIYSGTADLVDDADCAYTLDVVQDDADGIRTVKFENFKSRGDVILEAFYQYNYLPGTTYPERLDSVKPVDKEERAKAVAKSKLDFILRQNQPVIDAVIECISEGITTKTALIAEASGRSGVSKPKTTKAIAVHTGTDRSQNQFWFIETGENNSKNYKLNYGVSNAK